MLDSFQLSVRQFDINLKIAGNILARALQHLTVSWILIAYWRLEIESNCFLFLHSNTWQKHPSPRSAISRPVPNGYPNLTRYPVFLSIPDRTLFSLENLRVAGNSKYWVIPDISDKPKAFGITLYFGYSQTWLGISGKTPRQSWVVVGSSFKRYPQ